MNKRKYVILIAVIGTFLSGCHIEHSWVEATCTIPRHCSECDKSEGDVVAHAFTDANYQQPATCKECGETKGEVLEADFEKYDIICEAQLDVPLDFVLQCLDEPDILVPATVTFSDYESFSSDEDHEALEGYEWRRVTLTVTFDDSSKNATTHGVRSALVYVDDYYDRQGTLDSYERLEDGGYSFKVNYNGVDYDEALWCRAEYSNYEWIDDTTVKREEYHMIRVPIGYDGIVLSVMNDKGGAMGDTMGGLMHTDTISFRLE